MFSCCAAKISVTSPQSKRLCSTCYCWLPEASCIEGKYRMRPFRFNELPGGSVGGGRSCSCVPGGRPSQSKWGGQSQFHFPSASTCLGEASLTQASSFCPSTLRSSSTSSTGSACPRLLNQQHQPNQQHQ